MLYVSPFSAYRLWTPEVITTVLWLDAADSSTITTVSGAVSEWRDKSGNSKHMTQDSAGKRPTYTEGLSVNFFGANYLIGTSMEFGTSDFSFYSVFSTTNTNFQYLFSEGGGTQSTSKGAGIATTDDKYYGLIHDGTRLVLNFIGENSADGNIKIRSDSFDRNQNYTLFVNGEIINSQSIASRTLSITQPNPTYLGVLNSGALLGYFVGNVVEFLATKRVSTTEVQKMEGYLAHKWGLTANLPVTHPYKNTPPYV